MANSIADLESVDIDKELQALTNIKKENLINKINGKGMLVTVDFDINNISYKIERGRKPNVLKLYINGNERKEEKVDDDAQGELS